MTYGIEIPEKKIKDVLAVLKALDVKVKKSQNPNVETLKAMEELKAGKGIEFESVAALFDSIK